MTRIFEKCCGCNFSKIPFYEIMPNKIILSEKDYIKKIYQKLKKHFGDVRSPLKYKEPYQFCIAVILSAQCTDEQVNKVTAVLFEKFPTIDSLAHAQLEEIERIIYPTGYYKNKAKNIRAFCKTLIEKYNRQVPTTMEELLALPGVGRKTANVILQELYQIPSGIVVDTHVKRLSRILGLTTKDHPEKIEKDLMNKLPKSYWISFSLYLIFLGRSTCTSRKRKCSECVLKTICISSEFTKVSIKSPS
ncbi:MAG: endonuclease III [Leptospiraceae bacterium]|nr:endonuclease III [Leptospiraceae bacterium]